MPAYMWRLPSIHSGEDRIEDLPDLCGEKDRAVRAALSDSVGLANHNTVLLHPEVQFPGFWEG